MKYLNYLCLSLLIVTTYGCSDDNPDLTPQVTIANFEGSWKASSAIFTNNSNPSESLEFIGAGGEIRYTMLTGGNTRSWIEFQSDPVDEWDAVVTLGNNNTLISNPVETTRPVQTATFVLGNNTITLTNNNASFDFTLSGAAEVPATSVIIFVSNK